MWLFLLGFQNMLYMPSFVFLCNFCRFQRPTGAIPSSMLGLEAVTGSLEDFGFEHYLNGNYVLLMFWLSVTCSLLNFSKLHTHTLLASLPWSVYENNETTYMNIKLLGSLNQQSYKEFPTKKLNGKCSFHTLLNSCLVWCPMGLGNMFICMFIDFNTKFANFHPKLEK